MRRYYPLTVLDKRPETRDSVRITLDVPEEQRDAFAFAPGQHLPLMAEHAGRVLRRTYSICSPPGQWPLEIGVRLQPGGAFAAYVGEVLQPGHSIQVMPPSGRFRAFPEKTGRRTCLAFAAGSGITPILSIVSALLAGEPDTRVMLFYGNRRQATTMFIDDLYALKNRYPARLQLQFVFSREAQEFPINAGRLDREKVRELWAHFCADTVPDDAFVCGPDTMIDTVTTALVEQGMDPARVHSERFGAPRKTGGEMPQKLVSAAHATVSVILDGHRRSFDMVADDDNIVDAAAAHGIDLPYSCKGGVCATCRCRLLEGEVSMAVNYGLEAWEVAKGYILACQSTPLSPALTLDYDTP